MSEYYNPWLALRTYEEEDCNKFKGREDDAVNMVTLLQQNEYVVCYAASGDGKSSLINAGVCPKIRKMGMFPIKISITTDDEKELNKAFSIDEKELEKTVSVFDKLLIKKINARLEEYKTKFVTNHEIKKEDFEISFRKANEYQATVQSDIPWWKLRTETIHVSLKEFGEFDYIPVLIFDQFENVLRTSWKAGFFEWLEELSRDICPDRIITTLDVNQDNLPNRKLFKMLFSMRYEYVGELDYWCSQRNYIPQLMRNRYFLKPLSREQAIAIINEQGEKGDPISERLKQDGENIVERIISSSSSDYSLNDEVPAIMLSLSCYVLYDNKKNNTGLTLNDLDALLYHYYLVQINEMGMSDEDRLVLENVLITPQGTRCRIPTSNQELQKININHYFEHSTSSFSKLFKKEETGKTANGEKEYYIEFIHDKLAEAIQKNKNRYRIPVNSRKRIWYVSILTAIILSFAIASFLVVRPKGYERKPKAKQVSLKLTKQDVIVRLDSINFDSATSLKVIRRGVCPHEMDCYGNVLEYKIGDKNYHVEYAKNASTISFMNFIPPKLFFGPNTNRVFLLPTNYFWLGTIESIYCTNPSTILYVPYGCLSKYIASEAFSDICIKELSAFSTFVLRIPYVIHIQHFHVFGNFVLPRWTLNLFTLAFLWLAYRRNPIYAKLRKSRKWLITAVLLICYFSCSIISIFVQTNNPKLFGLKIFDVTFDTILFVPYIITILLAVFILYYIECIKTKTQVDDRRKKVHERRPLCCIIYNSERYKPYAIMFKKELINNGISESDIVLDMNIINSNGDFAYDLAYTIAGKAKKVIILLSDNDLYNNSDQSKAFFKWLRKEKDIAGIHPILISEGNPALVSIPEDLRSIITFRNSGTIKSFQAVYYNPNQTEPAFFAQLTNALKQKISLANKRASWGTIVILTFWLILFNIYFINNYSDGYFLIGSSIIFMIWNIMILYSSAIIDFPRLKKWKDKMDAKERAKEEKRKAKRELRKKRNTQDN